MTDEFDDLKHAMDAAAPKPDPEIRAAHLALARKNFDQLQGSRGDARQSSDRPNSGLWTGVKKMIDILTSRAGLATTTALVAGAFVVLTPLGERIMTPPPPLPLPVLTDAPVPNELFREEADAVAEGEAPSEPLAETQVLAGRTRDDLAKSAPASRFLRETRQQFGAAQGLVASADDVRLQPQEADTEVYANAADNPLKITAQTPVSTFSIDVDTASYAVVRNSLVNGNLPPADAVRVEEMINYFPYTYPGPEADEPFRPTVSIVPTPWNPDTRLVHVAIQGATPAVEDRPPLNLVFLIDTSGSMQDANKLPLLKQSFALMLGQLAPDDQIAIVTYAGSAGEVLEPTAASERDTILAALNRLDAGGSTAGQEGLQLAYATAAGMSDAGEVTRVILATDGDFNVGISDPEVLKGYIADQRDSGTYLSVLGFGRGNLDDATMQALAQNGNGQAAYIDTLSEAQKVLVDQLSGALFPIADDVKIQVEFNPASVAEYRLIGYETRALRREDFNNDQVDAGDIGAGHTVTAIYEITPVGSPAQLTDPLRYATAPTVSATDELGYLRLRYKLPGQDDSELIELAITADLPSGPDTGFAAAIAGFGQLLRDSAYLGNWGYDEAIALANRHRGDDPFGYRTEAVQLMRLAQSLDAR